MRDRNHVNVRPYLLHALAATVGVIGFPLLVVVSLLAIVDPDPSFLVLCLATVVAAGIAIALGVALWKTRPQSADIAFGELLIWGWLQRKRAEDRLDEGARLLGLDRSGQPTEPIRLSPEHQLEVLQDLNDALEAKDPYTHGHSRRVERHAYRTAAAMGLSVDAIEELRLAAALHDVGKIRVPDRVLRKPTELTQEERTVVEEHVVVGAWMVSSVGSADVISAVRHHHERWDGRGYPDGIAGSDIPLYARIIAVADAYDAITSTRPYRVSAGREHAVSVLKAEAGTQFDPMVVNSFVDALPVRLPVAGALVLLSGPTALGRKLAMWLKRLGAGHLAPAAATLGAMVTLAAIIPSPAIVGPAPAIAAEAPAQAAAADADDRRTVTADRDGRSRSPEERSSHRVAALPQPAPEGDIVLAETLVRGGGGRDDGTGPTRLDPGPKPDLTRPDSNEPDQRADEVRDEDEARDEDNDEEQVEDDGEDGDEASGSGSCSGGPNSNGAKNGEGHEKAKGEGHQKHCD